MRIIRIILNIAVFVILVCAVVNLYAEIQVSQTEHESERTKMEAYIVQLESQNEQLCLLLAQRGELPKEDLALLPIGINNNNPLNVKGEGWEGQIGVDNFGHAIFSHYAYGLRAGARVLRSYYYKRDLRTLDAIIERYCTGNKDAYKKFLAKRLQVGVTEELPLEHLLAPMLRAMVQFENGICPYPDHAFALADVWRDTDRFPLDAAETREAGE